jgi:hypothetical protein
MMEQDELTDLVRRLLRGPSRYERELHRDLILAGKMLYENTPQEDPKAEIFRRLLKAARTNKPNVIDLSNIPWLQALLFLPLRIGNYIYDAFEAANLLRNISEASAIPALLPLLKDNNSRVQNGHISNDISIIPLANIKVYLALFLI